MGAETQLHKRHVRPGNHGGDLRVPGHEKVSPRRADRHVAGVRLAVPRLRVNGGDRRTLHGTLRDPLRFRLNLRTARGSGRPSTLDPAVPISDIPVRVEFPQDARQDDAPVTRNLDHPIGAEAVDLVAGRGDASVSMKIQTVSIVPGDAPPPWRAVPRTCT